MKDLILEVKSMNECKKSCSLKNFMCGVFLGMAAGWLLISYMQNPKKMKRKAMKCTNAVEDLLDNVHYMFK